MKNRLPLSVPKAPPLKAPSIKPVTASLVTSSLTMPNDVPSKEAQEVSQEVAADPVCSEDMSTTSSSSLAVVETPVGPEAVSKPTIRVLTGEKHIAAYEAEKVLASTGTYFHAGGPIVRLVKVDGRLTSELVNDQTLFAALSQLIIWETKSRTNEWVRCGPPQAVVNMLIRGQDRHHLQRFDGFAHQPYFDANNRLVLAPGYNPATGLYGVFAAAKQIEVLSRKEIWEAFKSLNGLLDGYEFATPEDRSAALCAILTASARSSLSLAPAFNITASSFGSGKSHLANLIGLFASPNPPYVTTYPSRADEASKVVLAILLEKPAVILFDDMQSDWTPYGAIIKALTSATTTERLLGVSKTATARTNVLILGTGNNIEPLKDLRRRVVSIRLNPKSATPALRRFYTDPIETVVSNREHYVSLAYAIIRAYLEDGSLDEPIPSIGSYAQWSKMCREPLVWLGEVDPASSLISQVQRDDDLDVLRDFLAVWHNHLQDDTVTVRELVQRAYEIDELGVALGDLPIMERNHLNRHKLGQYLKKNLGRRVGWYRLVHGKSTERRAWRVVYQPEQSS